MALDIDAYQARVRGSPCFICAVVDGTHQYRHHIVYRDDFCVAFLNRFPTLYGYCLLAPLEHREGVVADFAEDEHVQIQRVLHRLGRAISNVVPTERLYVLSLGSQQGNSHVHWHVAPLPPGVPYAEQQLRALMHEHGYLSIPDEEQAALAAKIATAMR